MKPIRLRPHHMLCILTYAGKGYSRAFTREFDHVITQLNHGASVEIVAGPDDICAGLKGARARHCVSRDVKRRDRLALIDLRGARLLPRRTAALAPEHTRRLCAAFASGQIRSACAGCGWKALCDSLASEGFKACALSQSGRPSRK